MNNLVARESQYLCGTHVAPFPAISRRFETGKPLLLPLLWFPDPVLCIHDLFSHGLPLEAALLLHMCTYTNFAAHILALLCSYSFILVAC